MDADPRSQPEEQMAHLVVQEISGFLKAAGVIPHTPDYTYRFESIDKDIENLRENLKEVKEDIREVRTDIKDIRQDISSLRDTMTRHNAYVAGLVIAGTLFLRFWPA